jgi:hypothetical protein
LFPWLSGTGLEESISSFRIQELFRLFMFLHTGRRPPFPAARS